MNAARISKAFLPLRSDRPGARHGLACVAAIALAVGGCGYDWPADNDRGGPGVVTTRSDAGAPGADAADDARRDVQPDRPGDVGVDRPADAPADSGVPPGGGTGGGGGQGNGGTGGSGGNAPPPGTDGGTGMPDSGTPPGTGGGGVPRAIDPVACSKCQEDNGCDVIDTECRELCEKDEKDIGSGPAQGQKRNTLCKAVLACYATKQCVAPKVGFPDEYTSNPCYCGDRGGTECSTLGGNGPCADDATNAAGTADPATVVARWTVPTFPLGCANLIALCNYQHCRSECLGLDDGKKPPATPPPGPMTPIDAMAPVETNPPPANPPPANPPPANPPPANPPPANPPPANPPPANPPPANPPPANPPPANPPPANPPPANPPPANPPPANGSCPDLDNNSRPDCQESLLTNGDFDTSTDGWQAETDLTVHWEKIDGKDDAASGALVATNSSATMTTRAASQCVKVGADKTYDVLGQLFIKAGQGGLRVAGIKVRYLDGESCAGAKLGEHAFLEQGMGSWKLLKGVVITPARSKSALVLLVAETEGGSPFEAKFDNVALKEH